MSRSVISICIMLALPLSAADAEPGGNGQTASHDTKSVCRSVESPTSKARTINVMGNKHYADVRLLNEIYTRESDSCDPGRIAADESKLRAFYLTEGYADFRVSVKAEPTPDGRDFVITYVIEEGPRYKFGTVELDSKVRGLSAEILTPTLSMKTGDWFNAKKVEDVVTGLQQTAGARGYAFAEVMPKFDRDATSRVMNVRLTIEDRRAPTPKGLL